MIRRLRFAWKYFRRNAPWDTKQTPPEVIEFIAQQPTPGRALDLGCGTGTNVMYLAQHGWEAVGVDYVPQAIFEARNKAKQSKGSVTFYHGDVTHLERLPLTPPFTYFLDIGCFHSLDEAGQRRYAEGCYHLAAPDAAMMLYTSFPRQTSQGMLGVSPEQVEAAFHNLFTIEWCDYGTDSGGGWKRGWFWLKKV